MAQFKGTPNLNGRPKNALNKNTKEIKEAFSLLLHNNLDQLQSDIDSMKSVERFNAMMQLTRYVIPSLKAIEIEAPAITETNFDLIDKLMAIDNSNYVKLYGDD